MRTLSAPAQSTMSPSEDIKHQIISNLQLTSTQGDQLKNVLRVKLLEQIAWSELEDQKLKAIEKETDQSIKEDINYDLSILYLYAPVPMDPELDPNLLTALQKAATAFLDKKAENLDELIQYQTNLLNSKKAKVNSESSNESLYDLYLHAKQLRKYQAKKKSSMFSGWFGS